VNAVRRPTRYAATDLRSEKRSSSGRVVETRADESLGLVVRLLDTDECASRLGEAALVPMTSPLAALNIVFHNTLFDENDGCHLALCEGLRSASKASLT